jgi:hypothetical protein
MSVLTNRVLLINWVFFIPEKKIQFYFNFIVFLTNEKITNICYKQLFNTK